MMANSRSNRPLEQPMDPSKLARHYLRTHGKDGLRRPTLRFWRNEWWQYRDTHYVRVENDQFKPHVAKAIKHHIDTAPLLTQAGVAHKVTSGVVENVMMMVRGETQVDNGIDQPVWLGREPNRATYVSMRNGLLDIERAVDDPTNALRSHTPEWFSPVHLPYDYDPKATCPRWLTFLDEVLKGDTELIAILQEWFGYCLSSDTSMHKFALLEGEGANGKSVVLEVLEAMVGKANVSNVPVEAFGERFQLTPTLGKLVNIAPEMDELKLAEGQIKQFVAGDSMYFDRKHLGGVNVKPTARLVVATNKRPAIADKSNGFWRRVLYIPFRFVVQADKKDRNLAKALKSELSGILNWALEGRKRLYKQGDFTQSTVADAVVAEYREQASPEREFFAECCRSTPSATVSKSEVFDRYKKWAISRGYKLLSEGDFKHELLRAFPSVKVIRPSGTGPRPRSYEGIELIAHVEYALAG
jgi:putative DNA primase/helicase